MSLLELMRGAITMGAVIVALFFFRYWRTTKDRLFLLFSLAFCLLAANWVLPSLGGPLAPHAHSFRFLAFAIIAAAVIDKNRRPGRRRN